jgi:hypothetical protein
MALAAGEKICSFLKKRTKKLLPCGVLYRAKVKDCKMKRRQA